jgi:hypothetical protein
LIIECVEKEHVIIAVYEGFWGSQGYLLPVDSFAVTCQLWVDSGKIERELLVIHTAPFAKLSPNLIWIQNVWL